MSIASLDLHVDGADVERMIARVGVMLSSEMLSMFLGREVAPWLAARAKARFANEGDAAVGGAWAPLLPPTVQIRATSQVWPVAGEHPINRRSGEMEEWVTGGSFQTYPTPLGASMQYPGKTATKSVQDKVKTAQTGSDVPRTVARPVLAVDASDMMFVMTRLQFHLQASAGL